MNNREGAAAPVTPGALPSASTMAVRSSEAGWSVAQQAPPGPWRCPPEPPDLFPDPVVPGAVRDPSLTSTARSPGRSRNRSRRGRALLEARRQGGGGQAAHHPVPAQVGGPAPSLYTAPSPVFRSSSSRSMVVKPPVHSTPGAPGRWPPWPGPPRDRCRRTRTVPAAGRRSGCPGGVGAGAHAVAEHHPEHPGVVPNQPPASPLTSWPGRLPAATRPGRTGWWSASPAPPPAPETGRSPPAAGPSARTAGTGSAGPPCNFSR